MSSHALDWRPGNALAAALGLTFVALGAQAAEKITYATDWKAQAEHGGFYQAVATGLYAKYGLDVTIRPGGPGLDNQQLIAAGAVDFAMAGNNFFTLNLIRAGAKVRAVHASFQKDPQILMTHPRDDVNSLADMLGKPIMLADSSVNTFWNWLRAKYGFQDSQIRKYTFNIAPWLVDKNAIQQGYLSSEPYTAQKQGVTPEVYLLADYGYPGYAAMSMVPESWITDKPDVVQAFVNATTEGWYSFLNGDPSPGIALIKKDNPEMSDDTIAYGIAKMKEFGIVDSGDAAKLGIGAMTDARWRDFTKLMVAQGVYDAGIDWQASYTLRFINQGHGLDAKN